MKGVIFFSALNIALLLSGCAISERSMEDVGQQFEQGIQGRGQIVPNDPTTDDFGSEYR
ncbi:MAG: hypothetical protein ACOVLK_09010 [Terrimicrobiaceae bacterium]